MSADDQGNACSGTNDEGWVRYYAATQGNPPRPLLVRGVEILGRTGHALELGFGVGNEVLYLLGQGFNVTAVDADPGAVRSLIRIPDPALLVVQSTFDTFAFEHGTYDLVSAHYALPFNPPGTFGTMFAKLVTSLRPGGVFVGNLWGERDDWNTPDSGGTFHRREDALRLFEDLDVLVFDEYEEEVELACNGTKFGHWYEIIARRPV